jgi:hypothetical protein
MKGEKTKRMRRKMIILNSVGTDTPNLISTNTKIIIKRRRLEMMKRLKKSREGNWETSSTKSKRRRHTNLDRLEVGWEEIEDVEE